MTKDRPDTDKRLIDLESRLSFMDENAESLSDALAAQQRRIDRLENLCRDLLERVRVMNADDTVSTPADERPPHY